MKSNTIEKLKNGKNFETYVGFMISKELNCLYVQGNKYSFNDEKNYVVNILNKSEDLEEKNKIELLNAIESYEKKIKDELNFYSGSSSEEKLDENNIINNANDIKNKEKIKDIKGDFDLIFPNIETEKFMNMLQSNFNKNEKNKYIYYDENKLKNLPKKINLIVEVGLNAFAVNTIKNKIKQIQKYINIINFINVIEDNNIKKEFMENFKKQHCLNQNLKKNEEISNKFIYLIISNSEYGQFTRVFFDSKQFKNQEENNHLKNILNKNQEELILFGFVNFEQNLNYNFKRIQNMEENEGVMNKKINEQNLKIINQNKEMEKMKENFEEEKKKNLKEMEEMKKKLNDLELKFNSLKKNEN